MNKPREVETAFERALELIQARVSVSAGEIQRRFALAYSGGLDSSVLLHLAAQYAQANSIELHAFHVHHGLSPNADDWLAHCRNEAQRLGIFFDAAHVKIDTDALDRHGIEQAARSARYTALKDLCGRSGIRLLLAAHHQDDQAETMLLQLMRGAGLPGLSGMAPLQEQHALLGKEVALGRPLLEVGRRALEDYAVRHSVSHVTDESNQDVSYRRNVLRNLAFPLLEEHFPGFASCVARSARHVQSAQQLLHELAESDLMACRDADNEMVLRIDELKRLSPQRCDNLLRHWLGTQGMLMPSTVRLAQLRPQLFDAQHDRQPVWKFGGFALSRVGACLVARPNLGRPPDEDVLLRWNGEYELAVPQWRGTLVFEPVASGGLAASALRAMPLAIRTRSGREKLKIASNRPSKTLKNLFQEAAVPAWQREWLPLFYLEDKLVFAAGLGMDARYGSGSEGIRLLWRPDWQNTR